MRRLALATFWLVVATIVQVPHARAGESYVCWYQPAPANGVGDTAVLCRVDGSLVVEFPGGDPPVVTVPDIGFDATGPCWYRRSGPYSGWVLAAVFPDRDARLWWSPSGDPAGPYLGDATYRACVSEPTPTPPPITAVWEYLERYPFAVPRPELTPSVRGIVGLPVHIGLRPPDPVAARIASPLGGWIDVELRVVAVTVDWGERRASFAPDTWHLLLGYPDGAVHHTFQTSAVHVIAVGYEWAVRWRIGGGAWQSIGVPPTERSISYPVDEVVGRRTS
jgi:hypothetical protein